MFDKKIIEAYKSITAPEELKERIMDIQNDNNSTRKPISFNSRYRRALTFAACIVLILSYSFIAFNNTAQFSVYVEGAKLGDIPVQVPISPSQNPMPRSMPFSFPVISIPLRIETDRNTKVTVSQGELIKLDTKGIPGDSGAAAMDLTEDTEILWNIPDISFTDKPLLSIWGKRKESIYLLKYDEGTGAWTIELQK